MVTSLYQPARSCASCGQFGEDKFRSVRVRKSDVLEVSLEGPAEGHLLAAGDARLLYPREHETFGEAALGHARDVSGPEQCTARDVMLQFEDVSALL